MFFGEASRIVMDADTPYKCMQIMKQIYPNSEVVRLWKLNKKFRRKLVMRTLTNRATYKFVYPYGGFSYEKFSRLFDNLCSEFKEGYIYDKVKNCRIK